MRRALLVLLAACGSPPSPALVEVADYATLPTHQLDVLVLINDEVSTVHYQQSLGLAMPTFLASLAAIDSGVPDLHVGVATSDLGTSGSSDPEHPAPPIGQSGPGGCVGQGDGGALKISGAPVTGTFLVDEAALPGGRTGNYTGTLQDALARMFQVGSRGCVFAQYLAGVRRALARPDNAAFLRATANLLVLIIGDEDDCSVADPSLFGSDSQLGPLTTFRCIAFGITCNKGLDDVGPKSGCHARTDSLYIEDIATTVDFLRRLKEEPARIATAVIAAPPEPFDIELRPATSGGTPLLALAHGCDWQIDNNATAVADPAVRLDEFGRAFGGRGAVTSICNNDLGPQLREIGRVTKQMFGTVCLDTTRVDPASCVVEDVDAQGLATEVPYDIVTDPVGCPETADHLRVVAHRSAPAATGTHVRVSCVLP